MQFLKDLFNFKKKRKVYNHHPFRGFIFLDEGKYYADIFQVEVKERQTLFGKEESYMEYDIYPDVPVPVAHKSDKGNYGLLFHATVRAGGYKDALRKLANKIDWDRKVESDFDFAEGLHYGTEEGVK
ncbi:hypothetical protein JANET_201 [Bacillus phage Janet]|nr:hypothetical protein JANET_201 [Bacillus phage Janet]